MKIPDMWSFDAIDRKHKSKAVKLECIQCGGTEDVKVRQFYKDVLPRTDKTEAPYCDECWEVPL